MTRKLNTLRIAMLTVAVLLTASLIEARRVKVKPPKANVTTTAPEAVATVDSVALDSLIRATLPRITFSGFDKPATSNHESFFVTNGSARRITGLKVEMEYKLTDGRTIHKRVSNIEVDIPAGEMRRVELKSFDTQGSFRYRKSRGARGRATTPFGVNITPLSLSFGE